MKLLIISARFPEYGYKGDQLRVRQLVELLSPEHELHVITGSRPSGPTALAELQRLAQLTVIDAGRLARALATLGQLSRGRPAELGWMAPRRLRKLARDAAEANDAVIASTVRVVTGPFLAPLIIDHIDALSANMRERAALERNLLISLAARIEARLLARHERRVAGWAAAQVTVCAADAASLPQSPRPIVIPHVALQAAETGAGGSAGMQPGRDIDVIFTGNMNYPPNRDAARWLAEAIVPELQLLRPNTSVLVAGRRAQTLSLNGVEVAGDVPDLAALLCRARVAIAPLRGGTGVPNKLLEAAAAGAAIVATPRPASAAAVAALTATDAPGLAAAVARLLDDNALREDLAARARADLAPRAPSTVAAQLTSVLVLAVRDTGQAPS